MYKSFFHLDSTPFADSPDPRFLVRMAHTREALATLEYGIVQIDSSLLIEEEVPLFIEQIRGADGQLWLNDHGIGWNSSSLRMDCESALFARSSSRRIRVHQSFGQRHFYALCHPGSILCR